MITWTHAAKQTLENYCRRTREILRGTGADAEEVVEDLRRHVEEEIRAAKITLVTDDDLRRILARVGEPALAEEIRTPSQAPEPPDETKRPGKFFLTCAVFFGVLLPLGTLVFEMIAGISAGVLFDPIPTWFQVAAIILVPVVNLWMIRVAVTGRCNFPRLAGWLSGAASGVTCYYVILYLPIAPFACVAIIYFGLGLVPLSPYFGWFFTAMIWRKAGRSIGSPLRGFRRGFALGLAVLVLLQVPLALTYYGISAATSEDSATQRRVVSMLRWFGDRELLLRYCYGMARGEMNFDLVRLAASGNKYISPDQAREIYYRVTGRPFNSVPAPALYTRFGRWSEMEREFTWDDALGGEVVAGRVKGLSLLSSRMDAVAEPDAAVVYTQWTLEFKNVSGLQREARAQIALPPGGVVSRLTLWVNGEEREAAFGGRSQVREAYRKVVVVQRRDPVLVTTCGPDRVLVQCFPVPPNGGTMKVRVGITAPLSLDSLARGHFAWPKFIERNFSVSPEFKHALWIDSPQKMSVTDKSLASESSAQKFSVHGSVPDSSLGGVTLERTPEVQAVWTPALEAGQVIRQRIEAVAKQPVSRIVFAIDGSQGMEEWKSDIAGAIGKLPAEMEVAVIVAGDEPVRLTNAARASGETLASLSRKIRAMSFVGGRDNVPALEQAWDLAAAAPTGAVIWIHDAQPVMLSSPDALRQRLERGVKQVPLYDLQTRSGPNRIAEQLDGLSSLRVVPRLGGPILGDLEGLYASLSGPARILEIVRERTQENPAAESGKKVSRHIERLWARDEARHLADMRQRDEAMKLAAGQQLVTPLTGAVVLENKQQYVENNLKPVDVNTVPTIPEPNTLTLLLLGGGWLCWRRSRQRN